MNVERPKGPPPPPTAPKPSAYVEPGLLRWMRPAVRIEGLMMLWHLSFDGLMTLCEQSLGTVDEQQLGMDVPRDRCIVCLHKLSRQLGL